MLRYPFKAAQRIWTPPQIARGTGGGLIRLDGGALGRDELCCCTTVRNNCDYYYGENTPHATSVSITFDDPFTAPTYTGGAWKANTSCCEALGLSYDLLIRDDAGDPYWSDFGYTPGHQSDGAYCYDAECEIDPDPWGMKIWACCGINAEGGGDPCGFLPLLPTGAIPTGHDIIWVVQTRVNGVIDLGEGAPPPPYECSGGSQSTTCYLITRDSALAPHNYAGFFTLPHVGSSAGSPTADRETWCTWPTSLTLFAP